MFFGYGVIVPAVSNNGRFECPDEFGARFQRLLDGFRAARIVVTGMHAILIDGRRRAHDAKGIEKMDDVALLGKPDRRRRTVNSRSRNSNSCSHQLLQRVRKQALTSLAVTYPSPSRPARVQTASE